MTAGAGLDHLAPLILAVDTATPRATVALCEGERLLAAREQLVTTHSEGLLDLVDQVLAAGRPGGVALGDLDALVCGRGPGSFTGLRIGLATVKGLCLAAGKPLCCVSSLLGVARAVAEEHGAGRLVAVVLDAHRDEVFCGLYRGGQAVSEEVVLPPERVAGYLALHEEARAEPPLLAGDGALRYRDTALAGLLVLGPDDGCHAVQAVHLARAALGRVTAGDFDDLAAAVPRYLRPPDIRLPSTPPPPRVATPDTTDTLDGAGEPERARQGAELSTAEREALLDPLRESGLRLDAEGRWHHLGQPVSHPRLARALHRWLDRLDDGRYVVRLDEVRYAHVEVDDAPYTVRTLQLERSPEDEPVRLLLSDDTEELLDAATLVVDDDNDALYCRVKQGRFEARLSRAAHYLLARWIEEDGAGAGYWLRRGRLRAPIGRRRRALPVG